MDTSIVIEAIDTPTLTEAFVTGILSTIYLDACKIIGDNKSRQDSPDAPGEVTAPTAHVHEFEVSVEVKEDILPDDGCVNGFTAGCLIIFIIMICIITIQGGVCLVTKVYSPCGSQAGAFSMLVICIFILYCGWFSMRFKRNK